MKNSPLAEGFVEAVKPGKPPRKTPAKRPNISELARRFQVSRESLRVWRNSGLNLADERAVAARVLEMRTGPADGEPLKAARLRKTQLECRRIELAIQRENENYVPWETVNQSATVFFSILRSLFRELEGALPEVLNGLDAPAMGREIKKAFFEMQEKLSTHRFMDNHIETLRLRKEFERCDKLNLCRECRQAKDHNHED
jgi:hypothetical protein